MKKCSVSLVIREMQIKTRMWYHCTPPRITKVENISNSRCWWGCTLSFVYWSSLILFWMHTHSVVDEKTDLPYCLYNNNYTRSPCHMNYPWSNEMKVRWKNLLYKCTHTPKARDQETWTLKKINLFILIGG